MKIEYPKSFLSNYESLLNSCPFNIGRTNAAFLGGDYEGLGESLIEYSNRTDFPDFSNKAKKVLKDYNKLVNFEELKSKGQISTQQYCDLFLTHIFDLAKNEGLDSTLHSDEIIDFFGIQGYREWRNIFDILINMGYLEIIVEQEDGSFVFQINGKGLNYIESGCKSGIIKAFLRNSNVYHDHSVNIETNFGQAFTGSNNIVQYLTINNPKDILEKIENIKQLIQSSNEDKDVKEDALLTVATLENEVKKKKPVMAVVKSSLEVLSHIATVSSYAYGLAKLLGAPLP